MLGSIAYLHKIAPLPPSPSTKENRHLVLKVKSQLSPSMMKTEIHHLLHLRHLHHLCHHRRLLCQSWCKNPESHCEDWWLCFNLCPKHYGCNFDPEEEEEETGECMCTV